MSGDRKRSSCSATKGQRYVYNVITLLILIGCSAKKMAFDCEEDKMMGHHCEDDPICVRLKTDDMTDERFFCEDKVLLDQKTFLVGTINVAYEMKCLGENERDPYNYLSMILSTNISASYHAFPNGASLHVTNCSAPSSNQSVLFGGGSTGFIGGWKKLPLKKLTIDCKHEKTRHFSMHYWSGLKKLEEITIRCPKLSNVDEDLLSGISNRLKRLQITDTEIQHLPENFFSNMEMMETLDLRRNKLRSFRRGYLRSMWNLDELFLGENEIEILDDDIFLQTENLTDLNLEKNSLTTLPTSVCSLRNLRVLNAAYNRISFVPQECLYSLPFLFRINLNGNRLFTFGLASESIIPTYRKVLSSDETLSNSSSTLEQSRNLNNTWIDSLWLYYLYLDNNSISSLPDEAFYWMVKLKVLKISRNNISHLPENIFSRNKRLERLLASNNLFTHIPARLLRNNNELRELDLSRNLIETLHESFFSNTLKLCHIDISDNRIHRLPDEIFQRFKVKKWPCVDEFVLDMSRNRLEDVPELSIPALTHLRLSENHLTSIKTEKLSQLSRLRELNLSHNFLHTIENSFELGEYPLSKLEVIDLSSNQLTELPRIYFVQTTLKHLNVSNNNFTESTFISITNDDLNPNDALKTLDMSRNRLKSIKFRHWRREIKNMKHLDLSHNGIDLEECIEYMDTRMLVWGCLSSLFVFSGLEVIILSHNLIAYIPLEFQHYLPKLRYVDLSHNKIKRLWHGDLLYTRARDTMDLELFRTSYEEEYSRYWFLNDVFKNRFPGSNNLTIDLRHNSISSLQLPDDKIKVVIPGCDIDSKFSRVKLLLGHNPFVCDCEVFKLLRYASKEMRPTSALERHNAHKLVVPAVIDIEDLHCSEPDSMKGKAIADVESWGYHWLPMIGLCLNHLEVQSKLGKTSAKPTKVEAMDEPPT